MQVLPRTRARFWNALVLPLALAAAATALSGCVVHSHHHPPGAKVVVIEKGHVHGKDCGHYFHRGRWYYVPGHVHGPGCGHAFIGGRWVFKR